MGQDLGMIPLVKTECCSQPTATRGTLIVFQDSEHNCSDHLRGCFRIEFSARSVIEGKETLEEPQHQGNKKNGPPSRYLSLSNRIVPHTLHASFFAGQARW